LSGDGVASVGPLAGVFVRGSALGRWTFGATGSLLFSGRKIDAVSTRIWELALRADLALDERARWLLGGALAGGLFTASADTSFTPTDRQDTFALVALRGGYVMRLDPLSLTIAPELRFYALPVSVTIASSERFGTGRFGAALTVSAELPIAGER
jgi:hypothetical protein